MRIAMALALTLALAAGCERDGEEDPLPCDVPVPFLVRRFPLAGLSTVEVFPDTPLHVSLNPNPMLVDGDTPTPADGASGLNLGTSAMAGFRDLGAEFQVDEWERVDTLHVFVDRDLSPALAAQFAWSAYQSQDNLDWTSVPLAQPVVFNRVLLRFEVRIAPTQARYLKLVTHALPAGATADPGYVQVFVTELEAYEALCTY
jgi:hypothetical protein